MKKLFQIVLVSSLSLLCFSCYYDEIEEDLLVIEIPDIPEDPNDPNYVEILFQTNIQPIFAADCINCHNGNRDPDLRVSNAYSALVPSYVNAGNASTSLLYTKLAVDGHQNVSTNNLVLIKGWINQGAKNN